jgi:hypothetical protein
MESWDTERYNLFKTSTFMINTSSASALLYYSLLHERPRYMPNEKDYNYYSKRCVLPYVNTQYRQYLWSQTLIQLTQPVFNQKKIMAAAFEFMKM